MNGPRWLLDATSLFWAAGPVAAPALIFVLAAAAALAAIAPGQPVMAQGATGLGPQKVEKAFPGLSFQRPVFLTHSGDGSRRLFVLLQDGRIMVFPNDPSVREAKVFLDIRDRVLREGNEEGLLGLAFAPDYARSGAFYIYYSADGPRRSVLSRLAVSGRDPDRADLESEKVLLEVEQPYPNHNGGMLAFGPDGYLYVALGDGGSGGDPHGNGQNTGTLLGSVLRLDVSSSSEDRPYAIPPDNPLVGREGARPEVWAYGLRNPWRFSFDSKTGDLWAADVGQNSYEEVDLIRRGGNYGWNIMEGTHCYRTASCDHDGLTPPVAEYRTDDGCSISGGYVYRGRRLPALEGAYIYADFCAGVIWGLRHDGTSVTESALLADTGLQIPSFGLDEDEELYILAFDGYVYRFVAQAPSTPAAPSATPPPSRSAAPTTTTASGPLPVLPAFTATIAPTATPTAGPGSLPTGGAAAVLAAGLTLLVGGALWLAFRLVRS